LARLPIYLNFPQYLELQRLLYLCFLAQREGSLVLPWILFLGFLMLWMVHRLPSSLPWAQQCYAVQLRNFVFLSPKLTEGETQSGHAQLPIYLNFSQRLELHCLLCLCFLAQREGSLGLPWILFLGFLMLRMVHRLLSSLPWAQQCYALQLRNLVFLSPKLTEVETHLSHVHFPNSKLSER
jgi:hypothetical protein